MRILALDPATKCGFAYGEIEDLISGVWDLSIKKDESAGMRLIRLRSKLNLLREIGVGLVVFERPAGRFKTDIICHTELATIIKTWAHDAGVEYRGYSPKEIKQYATGKGTASKADMIHAAIHKFGREVADDNEADALALWHLAYSEYGDADIPAKEATQS